QQSHKAPQQVHTVQTEKVQDDASTQNQGVASPYSQISKIPEESSPLEPDSDYASVKASADTLVTPVDTEKSPVAPPTDQMAHVQITQKQVAPAPPAPFAKVVPQQTVQLQKPPQTERQVGQRRQKKQ